ncbi:MAG: amidohydrolase family protein [Bacteroidales bacterium]
MGAIQTSMIDAHHHLWHFNDTEYGWIGPGMGVLKKDYLPEELAVKAGETGIWATVVVQARQTIAETEWLLNLAELHPLICGVVGWVDLRSGLLEEQLRAYCRRNKLVGVRHVIQDEPAGFMEDPAFLRGIGRLVREGLAYDLFIYPGQLEEAIRLVERFPEQTFVLDHMAKPPVRSGALQPWKEQIEALAEHPKVWCKISGLVTEADHRHWTYESLVPYLDAVTRAFGTERIMLGSDWPVCRLAAEYSEVMAIPRRFFDGLGEENRSRVFYENAIRCYGLEC